MESEMFPGQVYMGPPRTYNDTILTITEAVTPDPYVIWVNGVFYMTWTAGNRVEIWSGESLFDFEQHCHKTTIWHPPPNKEYSGDLWAPELHSLQGRWYVYFAADDPKHGNRSHRMFVLEGPPAHENPINPDAWKFAGRLQGMPHDQWAIDGTVITLHGAMCFVYSGWPLGRKGDESKQELYIVEMATPTECVGEPTRISTPDYQWEFSGKSGINEGPQFLASPDGRWCGIAYSCAGSWTSEYKMALLEYVGGNPVHATSWQKWSAPLLTCSRDGSPPFGPGHGNFVNVHGPGGDEVWGVFHATDARTGWEGRKARLMRVGWNEKGPHMGSGECGVCCTNVNWFLHGRPAGAVPPPGHHGGHGGGGNKDTKTESTGIVGEGKKFLRRFMK